MESLLVRCGVLLCGSLALVACGPDEPTGSMRDGSLAHDVVASDAARADREEVVDAMVANDSGSEANDSGVAQDTGSEPADVRWFEGEYRRIGGYLLTRSEPYSSFRAWTESDGRRRVQVRTPYGTTTDGTWRPLHRRAVEVRFSDGSMLVVDESSMRASCSLLRYQSQLWMRWGAPPSVECPFVRTLSDRECSLAGRSITWNMRGPGNGTTYQVVLRESGAGFYQRVVDRLDCSIGDCIYLPVADATEYFEWRIEDDRLAGIGLFLPEITQSSVSALPMCRRGQVYGTPTNLNGERCGDGVCRGLEWSGDCPQDCGYQSGKHCPVGSRCERTDEVCAANGSTTTDGTCRPTCTIGSEHCASACCGSYTGSSPYACFPATACGSDAPTCKGFDQTCTESDECCIVGGRASVCVLGLNESNPSEGRCRPACFRDTDCGVGMTCSCPLRNGQRTCSRTRGC